MTFEDIEALLHAAARRGLARLDYSEGTLQLSVLFEANSSSFSPTFAEQGSESPALPSAAAKLQPASAILSPSVGFFRLRHPAGAALPTPGDEVAPDAIVAFVQAGPLLRPVVAGLAGRLGSALVADGAGVGFGTPLYALV